MSWLSTFFKSKLSVLLNWVSVFLALLAGFFYMSSKRAKADARASLEAALREQDKNAQLKQAIEHIEGDKEQSARQEFERAARRAKTESKLKKARNYAAFETHTSNKNGGIDEALSNELSDLDD